MRFVKRIRFLGSVRRGNEFFVYPKWDIAVNDIRNSLNKQANVSIKA